METKVYAEVRANTENLLSLDVLDLNQLKIMQINILRPKGRGIARINAQILRSEVKLLKNNLRNLKFKMNQSPDTETYEKLQHVLIEIDEKNDFLVTLVSKLRELKSSK